MMQGLFASLSGGFFPFELKISYLWELRFLFAFYALGFMLLAINFLALFKHAEAKKTELALNTFEVFQTERHSLHWIVIGSICALVLFLTIVLPGTLFYYTPYLFALIFPANVILVRLSDRKWRMLMENKAL
jgi:amino acid transporter